MTEPDTYTYPRYLAAKETVDDRALNRRVWTRFVEALCQTSSARVLEVGAGIGATVERLLEATTEHPIEQIHCTLVDVNRENLSAAKTRLRTWVRSRDSDFREEGGVLAFATQPLRGTLQFVRADLFDYAASTDEDPYDALVAQAVFDLLPLTRTLEALRPLLTANGLWYLPIHFDGATVFEPEVDRALDDRIEHLYHASMSEDMSGKEASAAGARSGRRLLTRLRRTGATLLEAGSSDWVVFANEEGEYPGDEAYFLHHVLHFVEEELADHEELDPSQFAQWMETRRHQVERGELIYVAHQLDVLAKKTPPGDRDEAHPSNSGASST